MLDVLQACTLGCELPPPRPQHMIVEGCLHRDKVCCVCVCGCAGAGAATRWTRTVKCARVCESEGENGID